MFTRSNQKKRKKYSQKIIQSHVYFVVESLVPLADLLYTQPKNIQRYVNKQQLKQDQLTKHRHFFSPNQLQ